MRATVEAATDFQRQPDAETTAEKSGVTLKYEEMLAALEGLMAEMREETPQADASGKVVDQPSEERTTAQPNIWVEAHAALQAS